MKIGLRVDVDTFRGTKKGVPALCRLFEKHHFKASFFFSVGPDNMGRHLWRLLKPDFLIKMLRTNAAGLYGPEIIFMGTAWPGPQIGKRLSKVIIDTVNDGHELGLHAWDHHREQAKISKMSSAQIYLELQKGFDMLAGICDRSPTCSAVPGWRCTESLLLEKAKFPFIYNSDCRGTSIFRPVVNDEPLEQIQVPVTLPTYDEVVGRNGITDANFNDHLLGLLRPNELNVLTIHAEAEGGKCLEMFNDFIVRAKAQGWEFVPLGDLVQAAGEPPLGKIVQKPFPGREGWLACQETL
ncbi:MAG: 4-deoxy-4-formamido-L-arabinose-phosphoundecaprenol deformylase [Victivallaceae bacterium]|nr:4-deoxy-4-formamido-L-arabinose-phosphoundecaprenol deformylase [Victivallaceae bacterium]MDD4180593.1 4-deoxy-4-formamido-L-arabinose-phosphoundecaprenol deformylase [Victivallaceae bacterium]